MVERLGSGGEGRGDSGVRFDRLNELRVGEGSRICGVLSLLKGIATGTGASRM